MKFDLSLFKEFLKDPMMNIVRVSPLTGKQEYTCPKCSKVYTYPSTLHRHLKFECGKQPQFKCPHCLYRAHRKDNIKAHMIGVHGKKNSFQSFTNQSKMYTDILFFFWTNHLSIAKKIMNYSQCGLIWLKLCKDIQVCTNL